MYSVLKSTRRTFDATRKVTKGTFAFVARATGSPTTLLLIGVACRYERQAQGPWHGNDLPSGEPRQDGRDARCRASRDRVSGAMRAQRLDRARSVHRQR